jgi:hypothetical protein
VSKYHIPTIVVLDSCSGQDLSAFFYTKYPNAHFTGNQPDQLKGVPENTHGCLVASSILQVVDINCHLHFLRIFGSEGEGVADIDTWMFDQLELVNEKAKAEGYRWWLNCSWGVADQDDQFAAMMQAMMFDEDWKARWREVTSEADIFFAAGNSDDNDPDPDIDAPQKFLHEDENCHVIAACDWDGVPAYFSGDGAGLSGMYPGHKIWAHDQDGKWVKWSGTSGASPYALGDAVMEEELFDARGSNFEDYVFESGTRPTEPVKLPHPKAGWGCMNQQLFRRLTMSGRQPPLDVAMQPSATLDYTNWR